jgi:vancomycin resistance protein YoaR
MFSFDQKNNFTGPAKLLLLLAGFAVFAAIPQTGKAKTVEFGEQTWTIDPVAEGTAEPLLIRNSYDMPSLAKRSLLGIQTSSPATLLHPATLAEVEKISKQITQMPKSAKLVLKETLAEEFEPGQNGQALDVYQFYQLLLSDSATISLPVIVSTPAITLADTNELGINQLVAVGESDFSGSPANRLVNIRVGAKKFNGLIIKPGEEFSFNKFLGDVDEANGFLPELVIKRTGLVPELGGGLCQVSSTTFRAAMNAGLPILERRNHSFPVRYYAPQGTDATIYPGVVDLRFTNDLPSHMLIRTRIAGNKLFFEFYGTKDDRQVAFDGPRQYDKKPDGAMKASWGRTVIINGAEKKQTFNSNYLSPDLFTKTAVIESNIPNPSAPTPPLTQ